MNEYVTPFEDHGLSGHTIVIEQGNMSEAQWWETVESIDKMHSDVVTTAIKVMNLSTDGTRRCHYVNFA